MTPVKIVKRKGNVSLELILSRRKYGFSVLFGHLLTRGTRHCFRLGTGLGGYDISKYIFILLKVIQEFLQAIRV